MTRCWHHRRRKAVACGSFTKRGYCRGCWPEHAEWPAGYLSPIEKAYWPNPVPKIGDAALWLAA